MTRVPVASARGQVSRRYVFLTRTELLARDRSGLPKPRLFDAMYAAGLLRLHWHILFRSLGRKHSLTLDATEDLFPVHSDMLRCIDSEPDLIALHSENRDDNVVSDH